MNAPETVSIPALPGLVRRESQEPGTLGDFVAIAHRNGWDPVALALVIDAESGWDPRAQGPGTVQAQGLNQISKANRRAFGLPSDVRAWGARIQLRRIVEPYFQRVLGRRILSEPWQYYAANLIGTPSGTPGQPLRDGRGELVAGNPSYDGNKALFDPEGRGFIGPEHLAAVLESRHATARGRTLAVRIAELRPLARRPARGRASRSCSSLELSSGARCASRNGAERRLE